MAELLVGFPRRGTVEIAACDCGRKFVMWNEDFDLFTHENDHEAAGEAFTTEVVHVRLPYLMAQHRRWFDPPRRGRS